MVSVPADMPVTIPVPEPTVALAILLLDQTPPSNVPPLSVVVLPIQTLDTPVIGEAAGIIVTGRYALQPVGKEYVMVADPRAIPLMMPEEIPIVAADPLLVQLPPVIESVNKAEDPAHIWSGPSGTAGTGFTVTIKATLQPEGKRYVIGLVPGNIPVNTPVIESIWALAEPEYQRPPDKELLKVIDKPWHTVDGPVIDGNGITFTVTTDTHPLRVV
jgi:hypothetical protein